jgi:hypothetical protein
MLHTRICDKLGHEIKSAVEIVREVVTEAERILQKIERESPGHSMPGMNRWSFEGTEEGKMRPPQA